MKIEKLLEDYEDAIRTLVNDEACESADPNRENASYARLKVKKLREKIIKLYEKETICIIKSTSSESI